jgi:glycosyltransferase involved in cell wall biosynthesis
LKSELKAFHETNGRISVVIPAYQARKYLHETLESIGRQTLLPEEVLVVDDASPDPVDDIVAAFTSRPGYPAIRLIRHEVNRGQAAGRNTGIQASTGEWIAFIDSDDIWAPNHLEQAMCTLRTTGSGLTFCPATIIEEELQRPTGFVERPMTAEEQSLAPMALLKRCFIIMSSVVAGKSAIRSVGGFDEHARMRAVEDLDFFMKLLRNGVSFSMSEKSTLFYRKHPDSATCRKGYMARQIVHVTEQHLDWIGGAASAKRRLRSEVLWRAANQLRQINAPDSGEWLSRAVLGSLRDPLLLARRLSLYLLGCCGLDGRSINSKVFGQIHRRS